MPATFTPQQQLPEILRAYPQARAVFDRYGLHGCGGAHGPAESLEVFARTHGVEQQRLIRELEQAAAGSAPAKVAAASFGDAVYRPFFIAGLIVLVLGGALTGSVMLAWMGGEASFFAPGIRRMNAHANAMVYGFAGMFIMGFAMQALPRFRQARLWRPGLAKFAFVALGAGVLLRFGGEFFGQYGIYQPALHPAGFIAGVAGTLLELAAFATFAAILWKTLRSTGPLRLYEKFVFASMAWFIAGLVFSLVLFVRIDGSGDFAGMVQTVAILQEPLRLSQMFGAIGLVVIGVMLRFLPAVFGFRNPGERLYSRLFWLINGGLVLSVIGFPLMVAARRGLVDAAWASPMRGLFVLGVLAVAGGFITAVAAFAPWRRPHAADRSTKFIRVATAWLVISMLMLVAEPLYIMMQGTFGHGYHAGMRHAFTIGFMTMMIVAVTLKVIPNLNGVDGARLGKLWPVFVLLNVALVWRVGGEIAGDFNPALLAGLEWSGALAGVALLCWAGHLARLMYFRPATEPARTDDISPDTNVAAVVETWPITLQVFINHGFGMLANPVARRTMARAVNLRQACALNNRDVGKLVHDLRAAVGLVSACACKAKPPAPATPHNDLNPAMSVAEAASRYPSTAAVFARYGMDACCGGAHSLEHAAQHKGVPLPALMQELEQARKAG